MKNVKIKIESWWLWGLKIGSCEIIERNGGRLYLGNSDKPYYIGSLWRKLKVAIQRTFLETIYYTHWSRDCDMAEGTSSGMVYGRKAYEAHKEECYEWAEGPMTFTEISKEEYLDFVAPPVRDRVMEAFENGNGSSIYC